MVFWKLPPVRKFISIATASQVNGFNKLKVGERVRYVIDPDEGEMGAQASTIIPLAAMR